jgi:hypothetical protein
MLQGGKEIKILSQKKSLKSESSVIEEGDFKKAVQSLMSGRPTERELNLLWLTCLDRAAALSRKRQE